MDFQPLISIVITCYNGQKYIEDAINSILQQEHQDFEVFIIDDASTDSSEQIIQEYLSDARINYERNSRNIGSSASSNIALRKIKGDYVTFLDQDDFWLPTFLSRLVSKSREYPDSGLIYCDFYILDENKGTQKVFYNPNPLNPRVFLRKLFLYKINIATYLQAAMIKRECLDSLGYFSESLIGLVDYELWLRVAGRYSMQRVGAPLVVKRLHDKNLTDQMGDKIFIDKLNITKTIVGLYPELMRFVRKRDSIIYYDWAIFRMKLGDLNGAKTKFMRSLSEDKAYVFSYVGLLALLFGKNGRYLLTFPRWLRYRASQVKRLVLLKTGQKNTAAN